MSAIGLDNLPPETVGLRLYRIDRKDNLIGCEGVRFVAGRPAVLTTLIRAAISGRVEVNGKIDNHFADALDGDGNLLETVALDSESYRSLKTRWMPCKVETHP